MIAPRLDEYTPPVERTRPYRRLDRCAACRAPFPVPRGPGRPPRYCRWHRSPTARVRAYRARARRARRVEPGFVSP